MIGVGLIIKAIGSGFGKIPGKVKLWLVIIAIGAFQYKCMYQPVKVDRDRYKAESNAYAADIRTINDAAELAEKESKNRVTRNSKRTKKRMSAPPIEGCGNFSLADECINSLLH